MKGLLAIIMVLALVFLVEIYPHLENVVVTSGVELSEGLGTTPDTSQLAGVKALIWGAAGIISLLGIYIELTGKG